MANQVARGLVDAYTTMRIFDDGTFDTKSGFGKWSEPDRLIGFDHDADSMRRKSVTGRGGAALATGGLSLLASNNRGVVYVTVTGHRTAVRTFTTRNPSGTVLSSIRALKAAADVVLAAAQPQASVASAASAESLPAQLQKLADLRESGVLSQEEFAAAKARLLAGN